MTSPLETIIGTIAPHACINCGVKNNTLCNACVNEVFLGINPCCGFCLRESVDFKICTNCVRRTKLKHVWIASEYEGVAATLIKKFKFDGARDVGECLADVLSETLPYLPKDTLIINIPSAPSRVRLRGYEHTKLIAKPLSKLMDLKYVDALGRLTDTRQVGLKRAERFAAAGGAFYVKRSAQIKNRSVLLVDDVMTTGATLSAAAERLIEAGARDVAAVVVATRPLQ